MIRLDVALRQWGLAPSRAKAQELLREGAVEIQSQSGWQVCREESYQVDESQPDRVRLVTRDAIEYVSRGGRKLAAALDELALDVVGQRILDVGISTGGFADCLLRRGAIEIVGIDVGHDQLAPSLRAEPRLKAFEGINARHLQQIEELQPWLQTGFDLIVVDVSFISLEIILPQIQSFIRPKGHLLALVKPQFEVANQEHNRRGIVTDLELHAQVRDKIVQRAVQEGLRVQNYLTCALAGQDGNQEYFLYAEKP
ncbi:MAG: TlyA family RNA methyltransferase [Bdellovibrionales bacterium]